MDGLYSRMGLYIRLLLVCIMWSGIKEMRLIMILWRSLYFSMYYIIMFVSLGVLKMDRLLIEIYVCVFVRFGVLVIVLLGSMNSI